MNEKIIKNMNKHNDNLSIYACSDNEAIRLNESSKDFRTPFFRDIDKIIYSLSYIRYIDKTQVFSNKENDMISKRMTHVQMVSKIARTIGRALNLNEDLIEAASLGHDLGHVPYGHTGEAILNKISLKNNQGYFHHNVQSVRTLMNLENSGKGNNVTIQVLDAIFCHNGEILKGIYEPINKTKEEFLTEYYNSYNDEKILKKVRPMTLEGCVVRISDIIAYIGKDIEDAIRIGTINSNDLPNEITNVLGKSNSEIVDTIVTDIINNSIDKNYLKISDDVFAALTDLINYNYKNIYLNALTEEEKNVIEDKFNKLFDLYCEHIKNKKINEDIYTIYLNNMSNEYFNNYSCERIAIDFIAGMTDDFFEEQYKKYFN